MKKLLDNRNIFPFKCKEAFSSFCCKVEMRPTCVPFVLLKELLIDKVTTKEMKEEKTFIWLCVVTLEALVGDRSYIGSHQCLLCSINTANKKRSSQFMLRIPLRRMLNTKQKSRNQSSRARTHKLWMPAL
jgi:hypothetical protein